MKTTIGILITRGALLAAVWLAAFTKLNAAPLASQSISLQPGWNAIWLEVTPTNTTPSAVFAGVNIDSVWSWNTRLTTTAFIQDSTEPVWNADAMLMFVPTNRVESFQNNLHAIQGNRAYLVKLLGSSSVTVTFTGVPVAHEGTWQTDVFNLRGFPVDPSSPPTFFEYFRPSSAHLVNGALTAIYGLDATGRWTLVGPNDSMKNGAAYWVKCNGASTFIAPIEVSVPVLRSLDFDLEKSELTLEVKNRRPSDGTATVNGLTIGTGALSLVTSSPTDGLVFTPLTATLSQTVAKSSVQPVVLRLNRNLLPADEYAGVATITDGLGTRLWMAITARRVTVGSESDPNVQEAKRRIGLWIGYVTLNAVSEAHSGPLTTVLVTNQSGLVHEEKVRQGVGVTPTPVAQSFRMKLMLHVDTNGTTRLLKEVIHMFAPATFAADSDGFGTNKTSGRYVLLTDDTLIPRFMGSQVVDGKSTGRRFSVVDFDFPTTSAENYLELTGAFAVSNIVSGTISISPNMATNPFRHKFHPDHDNLAADFKSIAPREEVYEITRKIELMATANNPSGKTEPQYGDETIGGTYREVVSGLHRVDIITTGNFNLRRMTTIGMLNQ